MRSSAGALWRRGDVVVGGGGDGRKHAVLICTGKPLEGA